MTLRTLDPVAITPSRSSHGADVASRHDLGATRATGAIAWSFIRRGRLQYLPLLLSDYGRDIVRRKYDACSTDRAYANCPSGRLGPLGRAIDWFVLRLPIHAGLRQRLAAVTDALDAEVLHHAGRRAGPVRVLSAPCGLGRDLLTAAARLTARRPEVATRVEWHGLDLDASGDVLAETARRAERAGVPLRLVRDDLFAGHALAGELFDVVNCIGLTAWVDLPEVAALVHRLRAMTRPGGTLIVDNWAWHAHSALGADLEIHTRYHDPVAFTAALAAAGFEVVAAQRVPNGVCTVYVARAR